MPAPIIKPEPPQGWVITHGVAQHWVEHPEEYPDAIWGLGSQDYLTNGVWIQDVFRYQRQLEEIIAYYHKQAEDQYNLALEIASEPKEPESE